MSPRPSERLTVPVLPAAVDVDEALVEVDDVVTFTVLVEVVAFVEVLVVALVDVLEALVVVVLDLEVVVPAVPVTLDHEINE